MTMRNRQILVAVGLVILAAWFLFTWLGSSPAAPEPTPGPSPTGGIGSAPLTFAPSDGVGPSQTAAASGSPGATAEASPGGSGGSVATPAPGATEPPPAAVRWAGTWTNTIPDNATGRLEIVWTQDGSSIDGILAVDGVACFTTGGFQGTIEGSTVTFEVVGRDEVSFQGTIAGDRANGTFSMSCDGSQGTWEATRQP